MNEELVPGVEGFVVAGTAVPVARELVALALVDVALLDVTHQVLLLLPCVIKEENAVLARSGDRFQES